MAQKVFVALSGGVDSAVSAALLKEQGYAVHGIFIKAWENSSALFSACPWEEDQREVASLCAHLGISWETWNFSREYHEEVLSSMFAELNAGRTPNPDILCNTRIKFGIFLDRALSQGAEMIATGHFARKECIDDRCVLRRGKDSYKDQSYFLHRLSSDQLAHTLFPVGDMTKQDVRAYARRHKLPNAERPDSQGVCFIGTMNMREFVKKAQPASRGLLIDEQGRILGTHEGHALFTIGQRHGLRVASDKPYYVVRKAVEQNTVVIAKGNDHPALFRLQTRIADVHWQLPVTKNFRCTAKIRYRQPDQPCRVQLGPEVVTVNFDTPQRAVTPGQSLVMYRGDTVLGGGIIQHV